MVKYKLLLSSLFIHLVFTHNALAAEDKFYINKLNHCRISNPATNDYEPVKFQSTNNLLRGTGEMPVYCGKKIIIKGRLLDQNCVPVSDAKIYLWQVDCDGKYPYLPLRNGIDKNLINPKNASSFKGSGIATTNNLGEFYFITTYPPAVAGEKPLVNVRAEHRMLGKLQTKLMLSKSHIDDLQDDLDEILTTVMDDTEIYNFDITIRGESLSRY